MSGVSKNITPSENGSVTVPLSVFFSIACSESVTTPKKSTPSSRAVTYWRAACRRVQSGKTAHVSTAASTKSPKSHSVIGLLSDSTLASTEKNNRHKSPVVTVLPSHTFMR